MKNRIFSFNSKCISINSTSKVELIQNSNSLTIKNSFFTNGVKIANITNHNKIIINENTIHLDGTIISLDNTTFYDINSFELGTNTVKILKQKIGNDDLITNLTTEQSILFKSMEISSSYYSTIGLTIDSNGFSDALGALSSSVYFAITDFFTNNTGLILRLEQSGNSGVLKCQNRHGSINFIDFFNNSILNASFYSSIILNSSSNFSLTVNGHSYSAMQNSSNVINSISLNNFFNNNSIFIPQNSTSTSIHPIGIDMFFVNKFFYINPNFSLDIDGVFSTSTVIDLLYTNSNNISVNTINLCSGSPNYLLSTNGVFFTTALNSSFLFYFSSGTNSDLVLLSPSNKSLYFNNFYISGVKNSFYSNPINLSLSGIQIGSNTIKHIDNSNTLSDIESFSGFILPPNSNNSFITNSSDFFISWLCSENHSVNKYSNVNFLNINNTYNLKFADNILSTTWNDKTNSTIIINRSSSFSGIIINNLSFGGNLITSFPLTVNVIFYLLNGQWAYSTY